METIRIIGDPISKKRPRFARRGKFVTTYNDQETEESKFLFLFLQQWGKTPAHQLPINIYLDFFMKRPKSHYRTGKYSAELKPNAPIPHSKKPDIDNLIKFVFDALNGIAWTDDSLIYSVKASKQYDENPRTEIYFSPWEGTDSKKLKMRLSICFGKWRLRTQNAEK